MLFCLYGARNGTPSRVAASYRCAHRPFDRRRVMFCKGGIATNPSTPVACADTRTTNEIRPPSIVGSLSGRRRWHGVSYDVHLVCTGDSQAKILSKACESLVRTDTTAIGSCRDACRLLRPRRIRPVGHARKQPSRYDRPKRVNVDKDFFITYQVLIKVRRHSSIVVPKWIGRPG